MNSPTHLPTHSPIYGIAILGAGGRMGRRLIQCIAAEPQRFRLSGAWARPGSSLLGQDAGAVAGTGPLGVALTDDCAAALQGAQAAIDFTLPEATPTVLDACAAARVPLVLGTTGLHADAQQLLDATARKIPLLYARNFSIGVTVLTELARLAARALGDEYDAEILEAHHRRKVDAPSGTALALGEAVALGRGQPFEQTAEYARHGLTGPRETGRIGFSVVRAGGIVGDHTVLLASDEERVELTHRALDRGAFARGALRAARWLATQPPGRYDLSDALGLRLRPDEGVEK